MHGGVHAGQSCQHIMEGSRLHQAASPLRRKQEPSTDGLYLACNTSTT
jgi:hypothetical protein